MTRARRRHISSAYRKPHTRRQHGAALDGGVPSRRPARTTARRVRIRRRRAAVLLVVVAVIAVALGDQWPASSSTASSSPPAAAPIQPRHGEHRRARGEADAAAPEAPANERRGALGEADGDVPEGVTVFDDEIPAVGNLDPDLLGALRQAATDAAGVGVEFHVNSGWRSAEYQKQLLREAVSKYGSEAEASRWVATPKTSAHVSGDAVDIGPLDASAWLSEHGAEYGLCRIYGNEPWHYELRPEATGDGCPPMYADPTQDPRMHQ
jgi:D-alanyl-D-alanine carboxypeptidase